MKVIELINKEFWDVIFSDFDLGEYSHDAVIEYAATGIEIDLQMGYIFFENEAEDTDVVIHSSSARLNKVIGLNGGEFVQYELDDDDIVIAFALPLTANSEVIWKNKINEQFSPLISSERIFLLAAQILLNQSAAAIVSSVLKEMGEF
ncbi:hypothetical protein R6242_14795 [Iodobacter sp. CM08]|uniref:hypothetical protein n=1 Tax=Iodobacter sp. CM08 TaxID=3085902 RepID=UPI00298246BF|nr:hypothetical protein [Iodobacter sp. CM08]MDW5417832.1 hypothetical protein [Iodobacter sp. CM08]